MITRKNMFAKTAALVAGFALVASSFVAFAPSARAATVAELQAQVQALLAQIAALSGNAGASMTFTRDLTIGATGTEVTGLQNFLISKGYSIPAGATGYFGVQTQSALAAYQAANGISPAVGYFGPITRAKVNAGVVVTPPPSNGGGSGNLGGGEASLEDLNARDGEDDRVEEGRVAEVAEFEFDVEDGDVRIERLDLTFTTAATGGEEDEPWKTFDTIRILDENGRELAEEDVSDEDDWLREDEPFVFRFTGLNYVVREGDTGTLIVEVEAQNSIKGAETVIPWTVYIDTNGLRGIDGEGLDQYLGDDSETVTFDVVEEGEGEDLRVRSSSEDPDSATLSVEDNTRSDWYTVFVFELEAEGNDIEIDELPIDFLTGTADADDVIDSVRLVIDGKTYTRYKWNGAGTFASTTFDVNKRHTIDEGDRVEVEVEARFKSANGVNYSPSETVRASVKGENIEAEGSDDLNATGNVTGETHTLEISGINVVRTDRSAQATSVDGADNDYATFTLEVDITATEQDVFIPQIAVDAYTFQLENASTGVALGDATATTTTISSNAATQNGYYRINEGQTRTFTFTVTLNPLAADESQSYRLQLLTIKFADSATAPNQTWTATPASNFETQSVYIND